MSKKKRKKNKKNIYQKFTSLFITLFIIGAILWGGLFAVNRVIGEDDIDNKLIIDFIKNIKSNTTNIKSSVKSSLESHITAFDGELANISDTVINVKS